LRFEQLSLGGMTVRLIMRDSAALHVEYGLSYGRRTLLRSLAQICPWTRHPKVPPLSG
jgi:hypothetical protein